METVAEILVKAKKELSAGNLKQAEILCQKIFLQHPEETETLFLLGIIAYQSNRAEDAIRYYEKIIRINPNIAKVHGNMAIALLVRGYLDRAAIHCLEALKLNPDYANAYHNLGIILTQQGKPELAVEQFQRAIALNPKEANYHNNLAGTFQILGKFGDALYHYQKALEINPNYANANSNISGVKMMQGYIEEAIKYQLQALSQNPHSASYYSDLLLLLNYRENADLAQDFAQHQLFAQQYANAYIPTAKNYLNYCDSNRRLKIGYVSADFYTHPVAYFIKPILENHNPEKVEIFCYANVSSPDNMTLELQQLAHHWRSILGLNDDSIAKLIQRDEIDILVDLGGHTSGNKMLLFARKPAPIQVTYLGYPATTGLPTIDYRITDKYADPVGLSEKFHTEKLIRLPESFLCYQPPTNTPDVQPPPVLDNGYITFGCFNNLAKISSSVIQSWGKILQAVPKSKLLLKYRGLGDKSTQERLFNILQQEGIAYERVTLMERLSSYQQHLATYNQVDIALDTFPYNGTTTTFEALWMGVPVIVTAGRNHVSRVGVSILSNVGAPELIADSQENYINIAVELSNKINIMQNMRATQREKMRRSPLMQVKNFTSALEDTYQKMWQNYCGNSRSNSYSSN